MKQDKSKIKYFLYARKSSESEERQIQSIDDQINRLKELASNFNLTIKKVYKESKSAKAPNNRPIFNEVIQRIEDGEADGILTWSINRLSRNPIDSSKVQWLLQQGTIKSIQTIDREYLPDDNVLLFNVESGMANQFLRDLSKNVKRGMQSKLEKGWRPGMAPQGYLNELSDHTIVPDPNRFNLIRKAWDLMLTGNFTAPQILDKLNNEWGYRTVKKKRLGNKPLSMSGLYSVFTNLFYAGIIVHDGQQYPGKHKPMITLDEFDRVQMLLGRRAKPRPKKHRFSYTGGIIRCGECGCSITAERKTKFIKSTGKTNQYTYYRCTKKKRELKCSQPTITEPELEKQIDEELKKMTILPEFKDWALEVLNENNDKEIEDRSKIYEMQHRTLAKTQKELDELTRMRYRELIDDDEFVKERNNLQSEIAKLKDKLRGTEKRAEEWLELTEKAFQFATHARIAFINGDMDKKREIVRTIGAEFTLKDRKLYIKPEDWIQVIQNGYPKLERQYRRLEPSKKTLNNAKTEELTSVITHWQVR